MDVQTTSALLGALVAGAVSGLAAFLLAASNRRHDERVRGQDRWDDLLGSMYADALTALSSYSYRIAGVALAKAGGGFTTLQDAHIGFAEASRELLRARERLRAFASQEMYLAFSVAFDAALELTKCETTGMVPTNDEWIKSHEEFDHRRTGFATAVREERKNIIA
jgi:hypothetical protein